MFYFLYAFFFLIVMFIIGFMNILFSSYFFPHLIFTYFGTFEDLIYSTFLTFYYLIICLIYLSLGVLIVHNSFNHAEHIIQLKMSNDLKIYDNEKYSSNIAQIFKFILLNLIFLVSSLYLNFYFDSIVVKAPFILYICWTLGFTASFPLNKDLNTQLTNNEIKEYILLKSIINTIIFLVVYIIISYIYSLT
jgi:hypothetical protein